MDCNSVFFHSFNKYIFGIKLQVTSHYLMDFSFFIKVVMQALNKIYIAQYQNKLILITV